MTDFDLAAIRERANNAAPGPWEAYSSEATLNDRSEWRIGDRSRPQVFRSVMAQADAEFIAAARTDIPALLDHVDTLTARLAAVRALHQPRPNSISALYPTPLCSCGKQHPCPTIQAIEGEYDA